MGSLQLYQNYPSGFWIYGHCVFDSTLMKIFCLRSNVNTQEMIFVAAILVFH